MKIAIAGAHGVGKTTFAKALAEKLGFNYIYDIVREEAVKKGFVINENTPSEVQTWLISRQWELEKNTPQGWVADKSLLDYFVYGNIILKDQNVKRVIRDIVQRNSDYDFVFYLPIEFPMDRDGVRSPDLAFQKKVDHLYKECLKEFKINYIALSGSNKERVEQAIKYLN
jgi:nicotinamide riboside kinase